MEGQKADSSSVHVRCQTPRSFQSDLEQDGLCVFSGASREGWPHVVITSLHPHHLQTAKGHLIVVPFYP